VQRDYRALFPRLPERTRLFRLFAAHQDWAEFFLADPTVLGVADTYGIELRHPWREDRADGQIGGKGISNHRWIVGAKLAYLVNQQGLIVAWDYASAQVADTAFHDLIRDFQDEMVILTIRASMPRKVIHRTSKCVNGAPGTSAWWSKPCCRY
jgi:hypothetical protein